MSRLRRAEAALTNVRRRRIYRTVSGVLLVLIMHNVVTADDAAAYLQSLALALGIGPAELAARNVPSD